MFKNTIAVSGRCLWLIAALALGGCGAFEGKLPGDKDMPRVAAETPKNEPLAFSCDGYPRNTSGSVTVCEVREFRDLPTRGSQHIRGSSSEMAANAGPVVVVTTGSSGYSSINAQGAPDSTVTLLAYIYATAENEAAARDVAAAVEVHTDNDDFYATGPEQSAGLQPVFPGSGYWQVSFDAQLPQGSALSAVTSLGTLSVHDFTGKLDAGSSVGDIHVERISGAVLAGSSSGGIYARDLNGDSNLSTSTGDIDAQRLSGTSLIDSSSGAIRAADLRGDSRVITSTGDIEVTRLSGISAIDTSSGGINASDLDGENRLVSSTGDIQLSHARGLLSIDTSSGSTDAEDLDGEIRLVSSTGDMTLRGVSGTLNGETSSGLIELDLAGANWNGTGADIRTSSGEVRLLAPADYSAVFEFITSSGSVRSDFSGNSFNGSTRYTETVGGGGVTLRTETSSGDITLIKKP